MNDLKVYRNWEESGTQVQSALAPFSAEREGRRIEMLGSYATAELGTSAKLGVIAIQDEKAALTSVSDMRRHNGMDQFVFRRIAMVIGFYFAKEANATSSSPGGCRSPNCRR